MWGEVYTCMYSLIIGYRNNWVIMNFLYNGTDNLDYELINITLLDGHFMNISLIITELNYGTIDADDFACHGYYIVIGSSSPYTLQADLNIDGNSFILVNWYVKELNISILISIIIIILLQK